MNGFTLASEDIDRTNYRRVVLILLGPLLMLSMLSFSPPEGMPLVAWRTAAIMAWMSIWWATEIVPAAVTAFIPLVLFSPMGIATFKDTAVPYASPNIYLFLGGFIIAAAIERWNLHSRIALTILCKVGSGSRVLIGAFMLTSAVLSMWMSNTSTTMMMLPIALSVASVVTKTMSELSDTQKHNFQISMLLGIAYGATIGGVSTLVGTPPNVLLASFLEQEYKIEVGFARWMVIGLPFTCLFLPLTWWVLTRWIFPSSFHTRAEVRRRLKMSRDNLGAMSTPEKRIAVLFILLVLSWMVRPLLKNFTVLQGITDAGLSMSIAMLLFLVPSGRNVNEVLVNWDDLSKLPWSILILFGGGLTLAAAVSSTGLAQWLGGSLATLGSYGIYVLVIATILLVVFLTELTSNLATTAAFLPIVAAIAVELGQSPTLLAIPVALASSCAFMLPVATPPNAIVFSSGLLRIDQMARAGVILNLFSMLLLSLIALVLVPAIL